jgi:hypothetical protein
MEHRDPPPDDAEDPRIRWAAPTGSVRLALSGPDAPPSGRLANARARSPIAIVILAVILLGSYLGFLAFRAAVVWLGDQPAYQLRFVDIRLDPPPPPWYRGGSDAFLQDVRRRARMPERFSLLGLKAEELKRAFVCSPWIEEVLGITYRPLGVTVRLAYRRPVALVEITPVEKYPIDESAVILPLEGLDLDPAGVNSEPVLLTIKGLGLSAPQDPRPGIEWKPRAGTTEIAPGNAHISASAKLAGFLKEKMAGIDRMANPGLNFLYINPMDPAEKYRGLFLWNHDERTYVLWGEAPGEERADELRAEEKWVKMVEWSRTEKQRTLPEGRFWRIVRSGLILDGGERLAPVSTRSGRPPRDREAILTRDPGQ